VTSPSSWPGGQGLHPDAPSASNSRVALGRGGRSRNQSTERDVEVDVNRHPMIVLPVAVGLALVGCSDTSPHGSIAGLFLEVGGLAPGKFWLHGRIVAIDSAGNRFTVDAGVKGQFRLSLPPGHYRLEGFSPRVRSSGAEMRCGAAKAIHITSGTHSHIDVICSIY
jgi:hypothetical protein